MAIMGSQLKNKSRKFSPHWDLNHDPLELKASVLPMSFADPQFYKDLFSNKLINQPPITFVD